MPLVKEGILLQNRMSMAPFDLLHTGTLHSYQCHMEIFTVTVAFTKLIFASKTERDCETKVASLPPDFPPIKLLKF